MARQTALDDRRVLPGEDQDARRRPPGIREIYSPEYYAAFVRDADGNRLEAVTRRSEDSA
jgi:hypothetical protein